VKDVERSRDFYERIPAYEAACDSWTMALDNWRRHILTATLA
jgi:hypothetical protein